MIIDGRQLRDDLKGELKEKCSKFFPVPKLSVISVGEDPASKSFIAIKKKFGEEIGVAVEVFSFDLDTSQEEILKKIEFLNRDDTVKGIIVQLPLPKKIDREEILNSVSPKKDVDALGKQDDIFLAPVAGAVKKILEVTNVSPLNKHAVVVGKGKLVGLPVAKWLEKSGSVVTSVEEGDKLSEFLSDADIIVSGAGSPGIIKPEMIKDNVILIDAGTSESAGKLVGDADPACAEKCSVFTPVPGGVGPLTVACLFENLCQASIHG